MIEVGFKYKTKFDGGDIYEVIKVDGSICHVRNNNHADDVDRFKWVNISGLEHQIREHKYSKVQ
tara:strand:+ start:57 stop:248 length:192 start_codon:yes stop_codon:yes gene_type:complete